MTRTMYDSLDPAVLPDLPGALVASYIDGGNAPTSGWEARFQHATVVRIARIATTDAGEVGDCESTDLTPDGAVAWVRLRRAAGATPTIYVSASGQAAVIAAFAAAGEPLPQWWIAAWDGNPVLPSGSGVVAHQYADPTMTGSDWDLSVVVDFWPGVDVSYSSGPSSSSSSEPPPPAPVVLAPSGSLGASLLLIAAAGGAAALYLRQHPELLERRTRRTGGVSFGSFSHHPRGS